MDKATPELKARETKTTNFKHHISPPSKASSQFKNNAPYGYRRERCAKHHLHTNAITMTTNVLI